VELTHSFTVPASVEEAWTTFMDLEGVGGCFPGATVTEAGDAGFSGTVKVKLGPIALVYAGSGTFVERDDSAHRAVIEAMGKDRRGNGTAGATVTIELSDAGEGLTRADVRTDLSVTGKPAQFGRGVMQDVSDKLLGEFVACIEGRFAGPGEEAAPDSEGAATEGEAEPADVPASPPAVAPATEAPRLRAVPGSGRSAGSSAPDGDALDLGATVLPVLVKSYGRQVAAVLLALALVVWLLSRRRRGTA
jgi:carbon monoxide dehydrogenase subunit G